MSLLVEKGRITEAAFSGDIQEEIVRKLAETLTGCRHDFEEVKRAVVLLKNEPEIERLEDDFWAGLF